MAFWGEDFWDTGFSAKFIVAVIVILAAIFAANDITSEQVRSLLLLDGMSVAERGMSRDDFLIRARSLRTVTNHTDTVTDVESFVYPVSFTREFRVPWRRRLFPFNYVGVYLKDDTVSGIYFFGDVTRKGLFFPPLDEETHGQEMTP